ncbi:hypothetical protein ACFL3S_12645, partial [Gemmatimonadota bacterium]
MARLSEPRWYVVRNMLALAQRLSTVPSGLDAGAFLDHEDRRVRKEALALAVRDPGLREWALAGGLVDADDRIVRMALLEIQEAIPEALVPVVVERVVKEPLDPELRALGIRALGSSRSSLALEAIVEVCSPGKTFLGRRRLSSPSPAVLAALAVLSERGPDEPLVREVLNAARKSKDPAIRGAVRARRDS